jgi:hypothetical protein
MQFLMSSKKNATDAAVTFSETYRDEFFQNLPRPHRHGQGSRLFWDVRGAKFVSQIVLQIFRRHN